MTCVAVRVPYALHQDSQGRESYEPGEEAWSGPCKHLPVTGGGCTGEAVARRDSGREEVR